MLKIYRINNLSKIKEPQVIGGIKNFDYVEHSFFALFKGELPPGNEAALTLVDYENDSAIRAEILSLLHSTQDTRLTAIAKIPSIKDAQAWRIKDVEKLCEKEREFFGSSYPNKVAGYAQKLIIAKEAISYAEAGKDNKDLLKFFSSEANFRKVSPIDVANLVINMSNIVAKALAIIGSCERECISLLKAIAIVTDGSELARIKNAFNACDDLVIKLKEDLKELKMIRHAS